MSPASDRLTLLYNKRNILVVTQDGLRYCQNKGQEIYIDFRVCRKNWVSQVNNSRDFSTSTLTEEQSHSVGWRDISVHPPYIEFFTEPRIRFEFSKPKSGLIRYFQRLLGQGDEFNKLEFSLRRFGWATLDLS